MQLFRTRSNGGQNVYTQAHRAQRPLYALHALLSHLRSTVLLLALHPLQLQLCGARPPLSLLPSFADFDAGISVFRSASLRKCQIE